MNPKPPTTSTARSRTLIPGALPFQPVQPFPPPQPFSPRRDSASAPRTPGGTAIRLRSSLLVDRQSTLHPHIGRQPSACYATTGGRRLVRTARALRLSCAALSAEWTRTSDEPW